MLNFGGADGIRTHDLLDAIEARSQLRHGPTELQLVCELQRCINVSIRRLDSSRKHINQET
jgi:hypothetical protein